MGKGKIQAEPYEFEFDLDSTALVMIDMQRDFVEPGGFGESLGNDVSLLRSSIEPCKELLETARKIGMFIIHTREGHRPDLSDCPPSKLARGHLKTGIGDTGPMGRILVRGDVLADQPEREQAQHQPERSERRRLQCPSPPRTVGLLPIVLAASQVQQGAGERNDCCEQRGPVEERAEAQHLRSQCLVP